MKKSLKFIMLAMLLCVGFVFTGCTGGQLDTQVKVNIGEEEDYIAVTSEEESFMSVMQNMQPSEEMTSTTIKFTIKADLSIPTGVGSATMTANLVANVMVEIGEESIGAAAKATVTVGEEKAVYEVYYKDGYVYLNGGEMKVKMSTEDMMGDSGEGESTTPEFDSSQIKSMIMEIMQDHTKQKVAVEGNTTRYMIAANEDTNLYIIVKNNKVSQAYAEVEDINLAEVVSQISPEIAEEMPPISMDMTLALELTSNSINYPSFDGYIDNSEMMPQ